MATVLETSKISPPSTFSSSKSLPLVFFDLLFYDYAANQTLLFFEFPCSKSHFLDNIVPQLKKSLSLTLSHFLPLAGNIIHPLNPADKPVIRYESPDSVSFTVAECDSNFVNFTGNHPRDCDQFHSLSPTLPPVSRLETSISCPVLAIQVTLFPGQGISIGFVTHHVVFDASSAASFIRAWALMNKTESVEKLRESNLLPFLDRETLTNINGLDSLYWDMIVKTCSTAEPMPPVKLPTGKLRATFIIKKDEIVKLKNLVRAKFVDVAHLSSFTVISALAWVCSAKSASAEVADDEKEYFNFPADCRGRLNPPLPANYFGNCVALVWAEINHGELTGAEGLVEAAKAIGDAVGDFVSNEKGVVDGAESWPETHRKLVGKREFGVSGAPRFDFYAADFGWVKPKKLEAVFLDGCNTISLSKSRDFEEGFEIGISKPVDEMDAFSRVFNEVLHDFQ